MAKNINENNSFYISKENIVEIGVNENLKETYIRGRENKDIPLTRKKIFWSVGFFNSIELITDRKKQLEIICNLKHFHKSLFELFKSIVIYNNLFCDGYLYNLFQIYRILDFKQKIKLLVAYFVIKLSIKNYKYWFIRYIDEWKEYLKLIDEQNYIDKLSKKLKNKKIVLYGAGMFYDILSKNYNLEKFNIVGICDKKFENYNEDSFNNYKVIKPSELKNIDFDVILFTMKLYRNIEKSLKKDGVNKKTYSLIKKDNKYPIRN